MAIRVGSRVLLAPFQFSGLDRDTQEEVEIDEPAQIGTVLSINVTGPNEMLIQLDEEFIDWEYEQDKGLREVPTDQITEIPD